MGREDGLPDAGIPTNETDALWEDLYLSKSIFFDPFFGRLTNHASFIVGVSQIPYSSARQLPNATELIPGTEDQYIVELDVFHQLHCLNALRKSFYPERYWHSFKDYWVDDGSPPGRGQRNYTSIDAKHFGKSDIFLLDCFIFSSFFFLHSSFLHSFVWPFFCIFFLIVFRPTPQSLQFRSSSNTPPPPPLHFLTTNPPSHKQTTASTPCVNL